MSRALLLAAVILSQQSAAAVAWAEAGADQCNLIDPSAQLKETQQSREINLLTSPKVLLPISYQLYSHHNQKHINYIITEDLPHWDLLRYQIQQNAKTRELVCIDVGGNHGFYTFFMASAGCITQYFEIQNFFVSLVRRGIALNNISDRARVHHAGLSDARSAMHIDGFDGMAFLTASTEPGGPSSAVTVPVYRALDCIDPTGSYSVVKIDVEGFEIKVIEGMMELFKERRVGALLVEIGPTRWTRARVSIDAGVRALRKLPDFGYTSYVVIRVWRGCSNMPVVADSPRSVHLSYGAVLRLVERDDLNATVRYMNKVGYDCNFFFSRDGFVPTNISRFQS